MSFLGDLIGVGIDVVKVPLGVVADIATLGGVVNDHGSYTAEALEKLEEDARDL
jgi:hypothetical protein